MSTMKYLLLVILLATSCSPPQELSTRQQPIQAVGTPSTDEELNKRQPVPEEITYRIIERKMLNAALILSVIPSVSPYDLTESQMREIASSLVEKNKHHYMVRVFFYDLGQKAMVDAAGCRFEWTEAQGLKLSFNRFIRPNRNPEIRKSHKLPDYEVLEQTVMIDGRIYGEVLIPSFSPRTSHAKRERMARLIAEAEGFHDLALFSTRDAYKANSSSIYLRAHPDAFKKGYLGGLSDGNFWAR